MTPRNRFYQNIQLTQWFSQLSVTNAVPKVLAGFIELPVNDTTPRWPNVTVKPIAKGAINFESGLFPSVTPHTTNTRRNPRKNSIPSPCWGLICSFNAVWPKPLTFHSVPLTFCTRTFSERTAAVAPLLTKFNVTIIYESFFFSLMECNFLQLDIRYIAVVGCWQQNDKEEWKRWKRRCVICDVDRLTSTLCNDIENRAYDWNCSSGKQTKCDSGIYVAAGDVTDCLFIEENK